MEILTVEMARQRVSEFEDICQNRMNVNSLAELASCYFTLGDPERALPLSKLAWEWNRKDSGIGMNLAMILKDLGRHEESFHVIETAYWCNPDDFYIQLGYAEALLKAGYWKQAWALYDNSRPTQSGAAMDLRIPVQIPEWDGRPLPEGHKILVINEGGTGDRISYARWLPELTKRGINWIFYPYTPLFSIFERVFPRDKLAADGEDIGEFTHWCTSFSLPAKLGIGPNEIPPPLQISPLSERVDKFRINRGNDLPVVGLCYKAAELFQGGRTVRSLTGPQAMRLRCMTADKVNWVNLQHGEKMEYPAINTDLKDWEDTVALLSQLDAVVTVDTSVMHVAGCLNKPMAVLLSGNSCWKFLRTGKKLPWYPTANFYRNDGQGLEQAINETVAAIRNGTAFNLPAPQASRIAKQ